MTKLVEVLDSLPGAGKTVTTIKYMSEHQEMFEWYANRNCLSTKKTPYTKEYEDKEVATLYRWWCLAANGTQQKDNFDKLEHVAKSVVISEDDLYKEIMSEITTMIDKTDWSNELAILGTDDFNRVIRRRLPGIEKALHNISETCGLKCFFSGVGEWRNKRYRKVIRDALNKLPDKHPYFHIDEPIEYLHIANKIESFIDTLFQPTYKGKMFSDSFNEKLITKYGGLDG